MKKLLCSGAAVAVLVLLLATATQAGWNPRKGNETAADQGLDNAAVGQAIADFKNKDPEMQIFFDQAYGYAVFPDIGKVGIGVGGAHGKGEVYSQGKLAGHATMNQLSYGFQLGAQKYAEIIFFKDKVAFDNFTSGNFEFGAQASAVALTEGASKTADYSDGVAIFTLAKKGLMYEATISGQKFKYTPVGGGDK